MARNSLHEVRRGRKFFLKAVLLLFLILQVTVKGASAGKETCKGAFDVYFVLDRSSSLIKQGRNHFRSDAVPFVETLSRMFVSPLLRMSYITFADSADVVMPLTSDRNTIEKKLAELKKIVPDGPTLMNLGIDKANQQIMSTKDKRASVIIALTDGKLEYLSKVKSVAQANKARSLGSTVFVVGVSNYDEDQLMAIAGELSKFVFKATDFSKLDVIADEILDSSCVEIHSTDPVAVCINETFNVRIYGKGFERNGDISRTMCNFWSDGNGILIKPKKASNTFLLCESPGDLLLQVEQPITVQVSLNEGLSFISSNVTISAYKCVFTSTYLWFALVFLFLLAWTGLWWIWNFLACKKKRKAEEAHRPTRPAPPPLPAPIEAHKPNHWPSVDASYYGAAGAGGIKPLPVRWGDKGCTEAAMHLERTKDAKEVVVNVITRADENANETVETNSSDSLCVKLSGIFAPFVKCYSWMDSKRPTNEEVRNCICVRKM